MAQITKRVMDFGIALIALILLSPVLALISLVVRWSSPGPIFFCQTRIGQNFRPFVIYKFRTMSVGADMRGPAITAEGDPRITSVGRTLRLLKLDELPQLLNVLRGDMSFVGPRPEVPRYVDLFKRDFQEILQLRPGITDLASIMFRHESDLLGQCDNPEKLYVEEILPQKIAMAKLYAKRTSPVYDLYLIASTAVAIFGITPPRVIDSA